MFYYALSQKNSCGRILKGNISGENQPLRVNYENFNLNHTMLIQGKTYGRSDVQNSWEVGGVICIRPRPEPG
jgi:hypothetical protein